MSGVYARSYGGAEKNHEGMALKIRVERFHFIRFLLALIFHINLPTFARSFFLKKDLLKER